MFRRAMKGGQSYLLTLLLHPQASSKEREEAETTVRTWAEAHGGNVTHTTSEQKRRLSYPIRHHQQATFTHLRVELPPTEWSELTDKLRRQKKILRFSFYKHTPRGEGKTLKDLPPRSAMAAKPGAPKKEKAPLKKLDEKIEEILGEEVL
jgi:ribosomal protein S6